jgi:hypothetical protein
MKIPDDMYETVFGLATELVNASEAADKKSHWRLYTELREYCEPESRSGREHPFLWETLGDFTTDDQTAIDLYMKALERARSAGYQDYEASILFALAERYSAIGDGALAYKYALEANEKAEVLDDLDLRRSISEFLLGESANQP